MPNLTNLSLLPFGYPWFFPEAWTPGSNSWASFQVGESFVRFRWGCFICLEPLKNGVLCGLPEIHRPIVVFLFCLCCGLDWVFGGWRVVSHVPSTKARGSIPEAANEGYLREERAQFSRQESYLLLERVPTFFRSLF